MSVGKQTIQHNVDNQTLDEFITNIRPKSYFLYSLLLGRQNSQPFYQLTYIPIMV